MEPISLKRLETPKHLLKCEDVFGSLDRGCSLTKLLYVKSLPGNESAVSLEMVVFPNRHFHEALDWLAARAKEEGQFDAGKKLRATGVGGDKYKEEIELKLKMKVEIMHEFICQQAGAHFLLSNFEDDAFCYAESQVAAPVPEPPEWVQRMQRKSEAHFAPNDGKKFPAIFGFCGSGISFNKLNEDISTEVLGITMNGGKTFLGLAKLIVGTNDYNELMQLASRGFRGRVDTQAGEMIAQGEKSEYHAMPPDLPLFPFGKASDCEEVNFTREDLAASAIGFLAGGLLPQIAAYAKMHRVRRVYLGGHLFSGQPARDTFTSMSKMSIGMSPVTVRFLSNGHTGCLGALLISPEEALQKRAQMSLG